MATHPLAPTHKYHQAQLIDIASAGIQSPNPLGFAITSILCMKFSFLSGSLLTPLWYPSLIVQKFAGNNQELLNKITWLAPALGMPLLAFVGRVTYDLIPVAGLKGVVYGIHTMAMCWLSNIPRGGWSGMITLRSVLGSAIKLPRSLGAISQQATLNQINNRSEMLSSVAFITASVGLSFFGGFHVITANLIGHALAAATKVFSAKAFAHRFVPEVQQPL
jgi:hypothetical protein